MAGYEVDQADSVALAVRITGRVKWFDAAKGYGFIVPDDPAQTDLKDVLLHVTCLRSSGRENALEGAATTARAAATAKVPSRFTGITVLRLRDNPTAE